MTEECWCVAPWSREAVETAGLLLGTNHVVCPPNFGPFFLVGVSEADALALLDILNEDRPKRPVVMLARCPFRTIPFHDPNLLSWVRS